MKLHKVKVIYTPIGCFVVGFNIKAFGLGIRIDSYGITLDVACFWFGWER